VNTVVGENKIGVKCTSGGQVETIMSIDPADIADTENMPDDTPFGFVSFKLTVPVPGDTAQVSVYLSEPAPVNARWFKYDTANGWRVYPHATLRPGGKILDLVLKDGDSDFGDGDGVKNRHIIDPGGFGISADISSGQDTDAGDTGSRTGGSTGDGQSFGGAGGGGGGCFVTSAVSGLSISLVIILFVFCTALALALKMGRSTNP